MKTKANRPLVLQPRLRVRRGEDIALGPGKIALLEELEHTGSITRAAASLGMSYMRAWTLIRTVNRCFKEPLVVAVRGGSKGGGGAVLTDAGREVLALYQSMNAKCLKTTQPEWRRLQKFLRE
ncbi:MAG TPA: LysR family transcriptional regulator [Verrucomicrobiae bacterium]|nr:LysR family transcriptional regulator [Verrucomicrobiae bacterium]